MGSGKNMSRKILILLLVISILFITAISYAYVYRYMFIDGSVTVEARRKIDPALSFFQASIL